MPNRIAFRRLFEAAGIRYLLRDDFTDTRAAGAVNGTPATPGGHIRSVVDTLNKISIGSGVVSFLAGATAWSDPELKYMGVPITRTFGRALLFRSTMPGTMTGAWAIGFDDNGTNQPTQASIQFNGVAASLLVSTTASVYTVTPGQTYWFAVVLRSSGAYAFVKAPSDVWKLLFFRGVLTSNVYVLLASYSQAFTCDTVRVPLALVSVPILAFDTFNRSDGALGSTLSTGPDGQATTALTWNVPGSTWAVSSNRAVNTPSKGSDVVVNGTFDTDTVWSKGTGWSIGGGVATKTAGTASAISQTCLTANRWYRVTYDVVRTAGGISALSNTITQTSGARVETGRAASASLSLYANSAFAGTIDNVVAKELTLADLFASLQVSTPNVIANAEVRGQTGLVSNAIGLVMNLDNPSNPQNFVLVYLDGSSVILVVKCIAGVYTQVASYSITYVDGATLSVIKDGSSYRVMYNNALAGSVATISDVGIINNAYHGLFSTGDPSETQLDNFSLYARGTEGQYNVLDRYISNP